MSAPSAPSSFRRANLPSPTSVPANAHGRARSSAGSARASRSGISTPVFTVQDVAGEGKGTSTPPPSGSGGAPVSSAGLAGATGP